MKLIVGENEHSPDQNGKIELVFDAATPIEFAISSTSDQNQDIVFTFVTHVEK